MTRVVHVGVGDRVVLPNGDEKVVAFEALEDKPNAPKGLYAGSSFGSFKLEQLTSMRVYKTDGSGNWWEVTGTNRAAMSGPPTHPVHRLGYEDTTVVYGGKTYN